MRRSRATIAILCILAVILVAWWLFNRPTAPTPAVSKSAPIAQMPLPADDVPRPTSNPPTEEHLNDREVAEWKRRKSKDPQFEWKMPVNFYGKVVDESDNPIAGAKVDFSWTDLSADGTSEAQTFSDSQGRFALTQQQGKRLQVRVSKVGYHRSQDQSSGNFEYAAFFEPSFHQPNPDAPVVFRLRTRGVPEPLIVRQTLYGFRIDGTPHYIDLTTGRKSVGGAPAGDIAVRLVRPSNPSQRFDWSLVLEGVSGAELLESGDELLFTAPTEGYQPKLEYELKSDEPTWRAELQKRFFVRSRGGQLHALLKADVMAVYNEQAAIDLEVYANPRSSRNLELGGPKQASAP